MKDLGVYHQKFGCDQQHRKKNDDLTVTSGWIDFGYPLV
jgi:hypothetical protein